MFFFVIVVIMKYIVIMEKGFVKVGADYLVWRVGRYYHLKGPGLPKTGYRHSCLTY
jgi:hypothetical protein